MRFFLSLLLILAPLSALPVPPEPASVAVVYNKSLPDSRKLAESYASGRGIPAGNLVGLELPDSEQVTREQYEKLIRDPLISVFERNDWWRRGPGPDGKITVTQTRVRILVTIRGVPSRIAHTDPPPGNDEAGNPIQGPALMLQTGKASVDSELTLLGMEGLPLAGPLNNPYFERESNILDAALPILLVGRIDAHSTAVCEAMIRDALAAEKTGLWGGAVIDIANKFPQGDQWLNKSAALVSETGIPTLVDRFDETLPTNFPLRDTALYLGWYDYFVSGPFLNPAFRFKPGAVAVHIHSYSATQLRDPAKNWAAPLLAKGAAATLGNVHEPLLHLTHHLDTFTDRLLQGYTLVEAAYMAMPALSWQGIVLGDPLYRPFIHLEGSGEKTDADRDFRALRIARLRWGSNPDEIEKQVRDAAARLKSGVMLEALGHDLAARKEAARAAALFQAARELFTADSDKLRMDLLVVLLDRERGNTAAAINGLRETLRRHPNLPENAAATAWLNLLDPPPPPPAGSNR